MRPFIQKLVLFAMSLCTLASFRQFNRFLRHKSGSYKVFHGGAIVRNTVHSVQHPAFETVNKFYIDEYALHGSLLKHKKSGAEVISISAPDDNKVFGITFRTPPADSTGVPHILEHSVLCGSRKYPVKEPFAEMLKGSLQNFLNAFTYPDRTCYPVASTNTKDFYNLVNIYLDAVLHPNAVKSKEVMTLQQEGWHYELEKLSDPLTIKGVVYNEMKGVYSSPESIMHREIQHAMFPNNTYGVDSGGDPERIPDLTFEQFQKFHRTYYHPSNSRIFFYGDDDPLQRLNLLEEYLTEFDRRPITSQVAIQPKLKNLPRLEREFPISEGTEAKHMVCVNWLLNDQKLSAKETLAISLLDRLLLGTSTATLRKALTESGLGESVIGGGLSDELIQHTYSVGMKGIQPENVKKVEELIQATLQKVAQEGFEADAVKAALNTVEFRLREFNTGGNPKGLSVMLAMMSQWIYDRSPLEGIQFEQPLKELKDDIANGKPIFQELVQKYLLWNDHRFAIEMKPSLTLEAAQQAAELRKLDKIKESMSQEQLRAIIDGTTKLRESQNAVDSPEARETIPKLSLQDIDPLIKSIPMEVVAKSDVRTVLWHDLPTSGILYVDVGFDYSHVSVDDIELLPLLSRMMMETGTKQYDETQLAHKIGTYTGGIGVSYHNDIRSVQGRIADSNDVILLMMIRGKATTDNVPMLFDLMSDVLRNANLNNKKRAVEMLKESKARKESSVLSAGHSYAATRLSAQHNFMGYYSEVTGGLTSVRRAGSLLQEAVSNWEAIHQRLENIRQSVLQRGSMVINLTCNKDLYEKSKPAIQAFTDSLPHAQVKHTAESTVAPCKGMCAQWQERHLALPRKNEGFAIPSQVNYVAKGGEIMKPGDVIKGSSTVISRHISTGYLWDHVRVLGGAYGGFARFSDSTGRFVYLSYRDPNLVETLETYDRTAQFLDEAELSSEEVLQAIIGTISDLDAPMSADQKGYVSMVRYLTGVTEESRQEWRSEILATVAQDFKEFAQKLRTLRENGSIVVFGSQAALETANKSLPEDRQLVIEAAVNNNK